MLAIALENAKRDLRAQVEQAASAHSRQHGPFEVELDLSEGHDRDISGKSNQTLMGQVHSLVEVFERHQAAQEAGVRVQRVEVIDSDGDGRAAVNIMFDHAGYD